MTTRTRLEIFEKLKTNLFAYINQQLPSIKTIPTNDEIIAFLRLYVVGQDIESVEKEYAAMLDQFGKLSPEARNRCKKFIIAMAELLE